MKPYGQTLASLSRYNSDSSAVFKYIYLSLTLCVCVCVCMYVCLCVCVCVCVCVLLLIVIHYVFITMDVQNINGKHLGHDYNFRKIHLCLSKNRPMQMVLRL